MDLAGLREVVRTLARTPSLRNALELEARETREKQYRGNFAIIDTRGVVRLNYQGIADHLLHKYDTVTFSDQVYVYDPSRGIYRPNEGELEAEIGEICRTIGYEGSVSRGTREVLYYVMYPGPPVREYPFNKCEDFIPVMNGIVKIDYETGTRTLLPHSPENKVTFVLPVEYRPEADPGPIQEVLAQWVREEDIPVLAQIPAQGLLQMQTDETYKRSYVFQGEYNAGKSTYLKFLQYVLGEDSITHVSLQGITEDRFASGKLENKILNIYDDLPDQALRNTGIFKALTGSTHHSVERKNKQAYDGRIFAVHVFSCNRPPQVPEEALFDPAFWERWCYVSFPFFFALDPTFEEVLLTPGNASAFLNVVIDRMVEIRQGKSLVVNLSADQVRDRWIEEADPLAQFIKTKFERTGPSERHEYDRDKFFSELSKWYESEGIPPKMRITTLNALTRDLMKFEFLNKKNSMSRGGRKFDYYAYKGPYQWREESSRESMRPEVPGLDKYLGGE